MRVAVLVVVLAVLAAACGDSSPPLAETSTDRLEVEVVPVPGPLISGQAATFELVVTNISDERALLTFDTTQRGDVAMSSGDVEVYRWAERRAFAQEPRRVAFAPGQTVRFELDEEPLPVAPGDYEVMATVTGVPKLRTVRTSVSVVGQATTEAPSPEPTGPPAPPAVYDRLTSAVATTVDELAVPMASALTDTDAFDAQGAVVRQEVADAFGRLTFAELLLASQVVTDGDVEGARAFADSAAEQATETLGQLRSVEPVDRRDLQRLLTEHVAVVADYAAVVAAGGGSALDAPQAELEEVAAGLGPFVAVTVGGEIDSDPAAELFRSWSDAVTEAIRDGARRPTFVEHAHAAASEAVEPLALDVAQAYVEYLDLDGFDTTAARVRQELATQLVDEVLLLATAVDVGALDQPRVADVLDENADELAESVGRAPAIDASEEAALLDLWKRRDAALLDAAATPGGAVPDGLARIDGEIARVLADATAGELDAQQVSGWLEAQRQAVLGALAGLAT